MGKSRCKCGFCHSRSHSCYKVIKVNVGTYSKWYLLPTKAQYYHLGYDFSFCQETWPRLIASHSILSPRNCAKCWNVIYINEWRHLLSPSQVPRYSRQFWRHQLFIHSCPIQKIDSFFFILNWILQYTLWLLVCPLPSPPPPSPIFIK